MSFIKEKNMWVVTQIIGIFFVFLAQVSNRYFGLSMLGVLNYIGITAIFLSWLLPLSYQLAPSFFQPYFLGIIMLTIFGLIGGNIFFNDNISVVNYLGIFISFIGCILINI